MDIVNDDMLRRIRLFHSLSLALRIINRVLVVLLVLLLLLLVLPDTSRNSLFQWVAGIEKGLVRLVRLLVPVRFGGQDFSPWIVIIGVFALSRLAAAASQRCSDMIRYLRFKAEYDEWKQEKHLADNAAVLSPVNQVLAQLRAGKLKDREQLLKIFAEAKRKLDEISKVLTFLSIDVVDSTGMKVGEEKAAVEYDFKEYKRFVESKLQIHGSRQTVWTPDGVMSCFTSVDAAVAAAQDLINDLDLFNKNTKTMRRDFHVRCGINTGSVYFDDAMSLEEVSDRVIDIAAHFQKNAPPDSIAITGSATENLQERKGFVSTGKVILGNEVYEWKCTQPGHSVLTHTAPKLNPQPSA